MLDKSTDPFTGKFTMLIAAIFMESFVQYLTAIKRMEKHCIRKIILFGDTECVYMHTVFHIMYS